MKFNISLFSYGSMLAPKNWPSSFLHTLYRLYYITGGTAFFRLGKEEIPLQKNHFYLFPPSFPFIGRQDPEDRLDHMYCDFIVSPPIISSEPICYSPEQHPLLFSFLQTLELLLKSDIMPTSAEKTVILTGVLEAFLTLLCTVHPITSIYDNDILESIRYIETHYSEPITVSNIAASLYLNENYFIRKFKKALGITPYVYLSRFRRNIATMMIASGTSLNDAALATGYQYPSSLCHALKRDKPPEVTYE